jgi:hypothetical protein
MRQSMCLSLGLLAVLLVPRPSAAQYQPYRPSEPATGERYHVEVAFGLWNPTPAIVVSSESLGIIGSQIDAVNDLGITQTRFNTWRLVLRPAKKHKFRIEYIPISYQAETMLQRDIVFNGTRYTIGLPVNSSIDWKAWRLGYEYDFVYRDRGFIGFIAEAKWSDVNVSLTSPIDSEYAHARAPIPAVGGIARIYPFANVSITGEFTLFKLPENLDKNGSTGHYYDTDIYGTLNLVNNVGVQVGYRAVNVMYRVKLDSGDMKMGGLYFGGVARF